MHYVKQKVCMVKKYVDSIIITTDVPTTRVCTKY